MTKPLKVKPVKTTNPNLGAKLLTLTRQNTEESIPETVSLIEDLLVEGQTKAFYAALKKATLEEAEGLTGLIQSCVVNPIVGQTKEGKAIQAWLFAIPVLMIGDIPASIIMENTPGFEQIAKAIQKSGLTDEWGPSVVTRPYLYSIQELFNAEFGDIYKLSEKMLEVLRGEPVSAKDLMETHPLKKVKNQKFPVLSLRYIVGAVLGDSEVEDCFLNPHTELSEKEDRALAVHSEIMEEALSSVLGDGSLVSGDYQPTSFYVGLGLGLTELYALELNLGLGLTLRKKGLNKKTVKAIVSYHSDEKEGRLIQVSFVSLLTQDLVYGHSFKMEQVITFLGSEWGPEIILDAIGDLSAEVTIIPGEHPVVACDDCGTNVYMDAEGEFSLHVQEDETAGLPYSAASSRARVLH